jgi:hypothetical protein
LAAKAVEGGGESPETYGKARKTGDFTLEKDQKNGILRPLRIV